MSRGGNPLKAAGLFSSRFLPPGCSAVPGVHQKDTAMMHQTIPMPASTELTTIIDQFNRATAHWLSAERAADVLNPAPFPKVVYGYYREGDKRVPLCAYSAEELNDCLENELGALGAIFSGGAGSGPIARCRAKYDGFQAELKAMKENYERVRQESGIADLEDCAAAGFAEYRKAKKAVLSHRPGSLTEAAQMAQFIFGHQKEGLFTARDTKLFTRCLARVGATQAMAAKAERLPNAA